MRVDVSDFDMRLTQAQVDEIINSLLVNPHVFSEIACLEGQGYGVPLFAIPATSNSIAVSSNTWSPI